jgi:L-iditol 2-dehydrogenase
MGLDARPLPAPDPRMQSLRLIQTHDLRMTHGPEPTPARGEVLVKVTAAGVCGTDRHLYHGEFPCTPPVTLGHEFSGIIALSDDPTLPTGTHIACDPNIACHTCTPCLRGRPNLCTRLSAIGVHRDGGFADYVAMPAHRAFALPTGLDPIHAALAEPLSCTLHGTDLAAVLPGQRAIVIGGGVIGLMALQLLAASGAEVMLVTRSTFRRKLAPPPKKPLCSIGPKGPTPCWNAQAPSKRLKWPRAWQPEVAASSSLACYLRVPKPRLTHLICW